MYSINSYGNNEEEGGVKWVVWWYQYKYLIGHWFAMPKNWGFKSISPVDSFE